MDRLDCIGWIVSVSVLGSLGETVFCALDGMRKLACYWLDGMGMGRGWDGGTDVSRRRNGSATIGC